LAEAIISMGNTRQVVWEKRLALENDQFSKKWLWVSLRI
jgi:hypothetical protein